MEAGRCANCRLASEFVKMSAFEISAWNWYQDTVSDFALAAGLVADAFRDLRLRGKVRQMFMRCLEMIHVSETKIYAEKLKKAREDAEK